MSHFKCNTYSRAIQGQCSLAIVGSGNGVVLEVGSSGYGTVLALHLAVPVVGSNSYRAVQVVDSCVYWAVLVVGSSGYEAILVEGQ